MLFARALVRPVETMPDLLQAIQMTQDQDMPALTFYQGTERGTFLTYRDYLDQIDAWAAYLQQEGVHPGDRVATLLHNRAEVPLIYLAAMCIGAVVVPLNPGYSPAEMGFVIGDADPVIVLSDELTWRDRFEAACTGRALRLVEQVVLPAGSRPQPVDLSAQNPAIILYTSGTTSFPKGVVQTHGNLIVNAWSVIKTLEMDKPVQYSIMPFYHAHAVGFGMMTCLLSVGHLVMTTRLDPSAWPQVIARERVTVTSMVPSLLQVLAGAGVAKSDVPSLRWLFVSAAPLPSALARRFEEQSGLRIAHGWGLSEFTNWATILPAEMDPDIREAMMFGQPVPCVGYQVDGAEVEVVRPDGGLTEPGELGELRLRGPSLTQGYFGNPEASANAFRDGWLYSGDEGYFLYESGRKYFFVTDRIKDIIIRGGDKVSPAAVEAALLTDLPELAGRLVALGYPHHAYGEEVGLVVELADLEPFRDRLAKAVAALPVRTRPKVILWGADVVPRTHSGKTKRRMLVPHFEQYGRRGDAGVWERIAS